LVGGEKKAKNREEENGRFFQHRHSISQEYWGRKEKREHEGGRGKKKEGQAGTKLKGERYRQKAGVDRKLSQNFRGSLRVLLQERGESSRS